MIHEVKKEKKEPKKPSRFYRFLAFLVTVGLVAGAVGVVVNRDKLNFDALRRFFTYRTTTQDGTGATDPFPYEGGIGAAFSSVGGDLFSASTSGFRLYSPGGKLYVEDTMTLKNPAYDLNGNHLVAYDAGGTQLRVYQNHETVFSYTAEDGVILSARMNSAGYLAVVTRAAGFKGVVTIYNGEFQKLMAFRISSTYIMDAVVSPDGKSVCVVSAGQNGHTFESSLMTYSMDSTAADNAELTPTATLSLGNRIPLDLQWTGAGLRCLTEYGIMSADEKLVQTGSYGWPDRHLKLFSQSGDDFSAMVLGKYRAGSQAELVLLDNKSAEIGSVNLTEQVLSLSASGRYVAVLTADRLDIYTDDMQLYATLTGTQSARQVVMRSDGTALLVGGETAWVYIPA
ncbi:MAG: DUF5711 family protein [Oscillospiraceae bacterium]